MELGESGKSINLEDNDNWKSSIVVEESVKAGSSSATTTTRMIELEASIKNLSLKDADPNPIIKAELISKLEVARVQSAIKKKLDRKTAWTEEARKEVLQRKEFREEHTTDVFPELVWRLILKFLDPQEKALMSNISLEWRKLLKNERTTFLFHAVFPIIHRYLAEEDILNFRGVCKEWKGSLEAHLQNTFVFGRTPNLEGIQDSNNFADFALFFHMRFGVNFELIAQFLQNTLESYGVGSNCNPFISRKLRLGFPTQFDFTLTEAPIVDWLHQQYWNQVMNLLGQWGEQVWEVEVFANRRADPSATYDRLHALLSLMPNLRSLSITDGDGEADTELETNRVPSFSTGHYKALEKKMKENPLPDLAHLNSLLVSEVPSPIISMILNKSSSTLEAIFILEFYGSPNMCLGGSSFPRLKQFYHCSTYPSMTQSKFAVDLPSLENLTLQYLTVESVQIPRVFGCLNSSGFQGTLRSLTLDLQKVDGPVTKLSERTLKMLSLELGHLEELTVSIFRINLKTIDFILPMAALKKLTVLYRKCVSSFEKKEKSDAKTGKSVSSESNSKAASDSAGEIIKFGNYTNRLYESNIWNLCPELRKVTIGIANLLKATKYSSEKDAKTKDVKRRDYTREGYKQYCKNKDVPVTNSAQPASNSN